MKASHAVTLTITTTLLTACAPAPRPAEPVQPEAEPVPPEVQALPAGRPAPRPPASPSAPGSAPAPETLEALAACWFEGPYEYMFDGSVAVGVGNGSFGMMMAGVRGMLYYSHLNGCAGRLTGRPPRSYSDPSPFEALSGLPVAAAAPSSERAFTHYNRDIVAWGRRHLLPDPAMPVLGTPAQTVYDGVFSRFFRLMTEAYLHLASRGIVQREMDAYMQAAAGPGFDGLDWLEARYGGTLSGYGAHGDGTAMTPAMAIGFWLRRGVDGTSDELWLGLQDLVRRFDGAWFASLEQTYPGRGATW